MLPVDKKRALREHLALISTEAYLLLHANEPDERAKRYNQVQQQINAILSVIDDNEPISSLPNTVGNV